MDERSCRQHVVLLGIGHTNAHVVRMWGMNPLPDTDLTCISNYSVATYSGFLPATLAGQKTRQEMEIDLVKLCSSVGARLITGKVVGLDHDRNEIVFADRPAVPFDVLSIGIGSVPYVGKVTVQGDSLIKIKPMQTFLDRLTHAIEHPGNQLLRIVVVGGGVAGVELTFCLPAFLRSRGCPSHQLSLITASEQICPEVVTRTREKMLAEFARRGVEITTGRRIVRVAEHEVELDNGTIVPADVVIWATGAIAPPLLSQLDLPQDDRGFLETDAALRSTSGAPIFAVGDTGTIVSQSLPKAGVYAVRQGPILWENIARSLAGRPLQDYDPQQSFLKLINKGDGTAIGQWKGFAFEGNWVMRLKNRIDSSFMEKYRPAPMMSDDEPMQCRGCGCKLGAVDLETALTASSDIELEDAAQLGDCDLVASTDFFTSPFHDAYLVGRIAALHSASDILCTGAAVSHALANVVLPEGDAATQGKTLSDFLAGARLEFDAMGGKVVGGHTIVGPRMEVGFTVIGKQIGSSLIRKRNLQIGDQLYLTKPLGVGILMAAHMRSLLAADAYETLLDCMLRRQHELARLAIQAGITAGTDVTGFGLAGHLIEMLQASGVAATINLPEIPLLPGVETCLEQGVESSLAPANRRFESQIDADSTIRQTPTYQALFDPQTCGGMLFGIPEPKVDQFVDQVVESELGRPTRIGQVSKAGERKRLHVETSQRDN
jgi:selenide,water dikinase